MFGERSLRGLLREGSVSCAVECGVVIKTQQSGEEAGPEHDAGKRKTGEDSGNIVKKLKSDASLEHPPLNKFLQYLTEAGFRVSRTHFDPTGVRTDATLEQFKSILTKYSVPTYTNASQTSVSAEKTA
ncbi:hypothetical protein INR49_021396 [Caranx melampygus]|nr:hypothetical protein INR49_021396 [Caranx melampygus]